jgi:uncharacterized membrane protein
MCAWFISPPSFFQWNVESITLIMRHFILYASTILVTDPTSSGEVLCLGRGLQF